MFDIASSSGASGPMVRGAAGLYHYATFYGFLLCFAATFISTAWHYLLAREAPYPWWDLPVVLGTLGSAGLAVGGVGLLAAKFRRAGELKAESMFGMDVAFIVMLLLRLTPAMNLLLALHLGVVFALFITLPYSKFVHDLYRFSALVRHAEERAVSADS